MKVPAYRADTVSHNLISVGQLDDMEWSTTFHRGKSVVMPRAKMDEMWDSMMKDAKVVASKHSNGLYRIDEDDANGTVGAVTAMEWHRRLGHVCLDQLRELPAQVKGMEGITGSVQCRECINAKTTRAKYRHPGTSTVRASIPGEKIVADLKTDLPTGINGERHLLVCMDVYSRYTWIANLKNKSEAADQLLILIAKLERQNGILVKQVQTDRGGEFTGTEFKRKLEGSGVVLQHTHARASPENSVVERVIRTITDMARTMRLQSGLTRRYWPYCVAEAAYVKNRVYHRTIKDTPYHRLNDKQPDVSGIRAFGCQVYVHNENGHGKKSFDARAAMGVLLGNYCTRNGSYWVLLKNGMRIVQTRNVRFDESVFPMRTMEDDDDDSEQADDGDGVYDDANDDVGDDEPSMYHSEDHQSTKRGRDESRSPPQRPNRKRQVRSSLLDFPYVDSGNMDLGLVGAMSGDEPRYHEAIVSKEAENWKQAMDLEITKLAEREVFELVHRPPDAKVLRAVWALKVKRDITGQPTRFKARLTADGSAQERGIDFVDSYAPVIALEGIRLTLCLAIGLNWKMGSSDAVSAYTNAPIQQSVYMCQPRGFDDGSGRVWRLKKALYGLKSSGKDWYDTSSMALHRNGYRQLRSDETFFVNDCEEGDFRVITSYVDDYLRLGENARALQLTQDDLDQEFEMTHSVLKELIGIGFVIDSGNANMVVNQSAVIQRLLARYGMEDANPVSTPALLDELVFHEGDQESFPFRSLVGSLLWISRGSRPDIAAAVGRLSRHVENPGPSHVTAAKRVLRYLKGTTDLCLTLCPEMSRGIEVYADADYASDLGTRKSTTGYVVLFAGCPIAWGSKRQSVVSHSTMEAELIATSVALREAIWIRNVLSELFENRSDLCGWSKVIRLYEDNAATIELIQNGKLSARSKHIDVKYRYARDLYLKGELVLEHVPSSSQLADICTKPLPRDLFERHRTVLLGGSVVR